MQHSVAKGGLWSAALASTLLVAIPAARADDWYVDAVAGSDANDGQSELTAWRTLTHALASIPAEPVVPHAVHVAPGVYDSALGELFPLTPRPLIRIIGTAGSAQTVLEGAPDAFLVYVASATEEFDEQSGAQGLTLRAGGTGVAVSSWQGTAEPSFRELVVEGMSDVGLRVSAQADPLESASARPSFEDVLVAACGRGVSVSAFAGSTESAGARIYLTRAVVRDCATEGIWSRASGEASARVELYRCRVNGNGGDGIYAGAFGTETSSSLYAYSSLVADNGGCGAYGETGSSWEAVTLAFYDCTVVHNALAGVRGRGGAQTRLTGSNLAGSPLDVDVEGDVIASFSNSADGALLGSPECIAADPLFVDSASGDYRLGFGSPCSDAGDPTSVGELDLLEHARPYDGDLDTVAAPDMGAFELEPLHVSGAPVIGQRLRFELWGAPAASARLFFTPLPLAGPAATPFGELRLVRASIVALGTFALAEPPLVFERRLPDDPLLVGTSFSFQTLTTSAAAPEGAALGNPVTFVLAP